MLVNREEQFLGGAWGAVVDLTTAAVAELGRGHTMAYFNPGCGAGTFAAFVRYNDSGETEVASVDLKTSRLNFKATLQTQLTSPATDKAGGVVAADASGIVRIEAGGKSSRLLTTRGRPFDLKVDSDERLAFISAESANSATVSIHDLRSGRGNVKSLGTGQVDTIGIERAGNKFVLLGPGAQQYATPDRVLSVPEARANAKLSVNAGLVIDSVSPASVGAANESSNGRMARPKIKAVVPETHKRLSFELTTSTPSHATVKQGKKAAATSTPYAAQLQATPAVAEKSPAAPASASAPAESPIDSDATCAVPRNDPHNQVYQPKPRQVQWAVDRAVSGQLTELRPTNWRNLGMPPYSPQGILPPVALVGGGTIPPQVLLGVLAQESNLWQASRYTAPGSTGNPLIGDFYGSRPEVGEPDSVIWNVDFADADCGYGVGQITDGMRLAGKERPGEVALPFDTQRAIALDYATNVAMAQRMLAEKWNELKTAGFDVNNGDPSRIENWFMAVWAYNTGFHPYAGPGSHWGLGWFNNPINPIYPPNRGPFLDGSPEDAANPQNWPYPEKVLGFAANSLDLPLTELADPAAREYPTTYVTAFTTAWWPGTDSADGAANRRGVKPPTTLFCNQSTNYCDPTSSSPCTLNGEPECWWHADAVWKTDCDDTCGYGDERFDSSYTTESSAMAPSLPATTLQLSFPPDCQAPPVAMLVVDDVPDQPVRSGCTRQPSQGSFGFQFGDQGSGSSSARVDLHQQGGGYNAHFYWSHMRSAGDLIDNAGHRLDITGRWTLGQSLSQWTRVWIHLPDHAAWTEQAAYTIEFGDGQSQTRYLPQRRYQNQWVPIGVFQMNGVPSVSLSNLSAASRGVNSDDIAWDAVGFEPLPAKPTDFVVALGDSFSSGEGAGGYAAWSDHDGDTDSIRNACHQSSNSWIGKTTLPGRTQSIGALVNSKSASLDFQFLACSGAETENLLPYYTVPSDSRPTNGEGQHGAGQFGMVSQLDAGYLDTNTTLVTLSIGGNDMKFGPIVAACVRVVMMCDDNVLPGDTAGAFAASLDRAAGPLASSLQTVLSQVRRLAPNAVIALVGYPRLFDLGTACIGIAGGNSDWLNAVTDATMTTMRNQAALADSLGQGKVLFVDPQTRFQGHTLCSDAGEVIYGASGINGIVLNFTPGDAPMSPNSPTSAQSVHPNDLGTTLYAQALQDALSEAN
ncbi:MAG TPA: SGNH/GDSL hydrolase family protein [Candidatus Lumbricidophila sp.]|nr:SGNH/GDSL hydrolase family protein [Candidatus Lumbricidophila sp.]